jgi:erythrin-vacuolar iron transport family protein
MEQPKARREARVENTMEQERPENEKPEDGKSTATELVQTVVKGATAEDEEARRFLLRVVQPGLAGLMDGSVSTLAPIFATAFSTHHPFTAFLVGMASATGAGISMAFSEALSDTGELTGRGNPVMRGIITGMMTFLGGSLHTLPFLVPEIHLALIIAYCVVAFELVVIAAIRHRYFGTSWWLSIAQVVGGGALVFAAAWLFGNA